MLVTHTPNLVWFRPMVKEEIAKQTDGLTEAITLYPLLFKKKLGDKKTIFIYNPAKLTWYDWKHAIWYAEHKDEICIQISTCSAYI